MSYIYSKRGSSFGEDASFGEYLGEDPLTALQSVRGIYPNIVSGPAPTHSSTLSREDIPVYIPSRTLTQSPSVAVETGTVALRQALYQPPLVDTKYQDASLFNDVPIRPTVPMIENPTVLPTAPPVTMERAYASEAAPSQLTTAYVNDRMVPLSPEAPASRLPTPSPTYTTPTAPPPTQGVYSAPPSTPTQEGTYYPTTPPPLPSSPKTAFVAPPLPATMESGQATFPPAPLPKEDSVASFHPNLEAFVKPDQSTKLYPTATPAGSVVAAPTELVIPTESSGPVGKAVTPTPAWTTTPVSAPGVVSGKGASTTPLIVGVAALALLLFRR